MSLRLGWPATEWETSPEPKMAEKWPAKWPTENGRKMAGQLKSGDFLHIRPFARPIFGQFGTLSGAGRHFASNFWFWARFLLWEIAKGGGAKRIVRFWRGGKRTTRIPTVRFPKTGILGLPRKQKIAVNKFWVQESEIGEECRQFWT